MLARPAIWLALSGSLLVLAPEALAQTDAAAAEALFQEGKQLLDHGRVVEACAKLGESYRLDPGTGALLLLAHCHEREGKLASAWAELSEAAARARKEGSAEREAFARERAAALAPRLSRLTIEVAPAVLALPGLVVERDRVAVGRGSLGAALPVDGGEHVVTATAPGQRPWQTRVRVGSEADAATVTITTLEREPVVAAPAARGAGRAPATQARDEGLAATQIAGIVSGGLGLAALGASGYLSLRAVDAKNESNDRGCNGNVCVGDAADLRNDAVSFADAATIAGVSGVVLAGAGVTLFVLGRRSEAPAAATAQHVELVLRPGSAAVQGTF